MRSPSLVFTCGIYGDFRIHYCYLFILHDNGQEDVTRRRYGRIHTDFALVRTNYSLCLYYCPCCYDFYAFFKWRRIHGSYPILTILYINALPILVHAILVTDMFPNTSTAKPRAFFREFLCNLFCHWSTLYRCESFHKCTVYLAATG